MRRILIAEDDRLLREVLKLELEMVIPDSEILAAGGLSEAIALLKTARVDLILSDLMMPDGTGADLLHWVRSQPGRPPEFILMTGFLDQQKIETPKGIAAVLMKPFDGEVLTDLVLRLLDQDQEQEPRQSIAQ